MNIELQAYYERRLSMMGDQAWKDLIDDVEEMIKARDCLSGISTVEQLQFAKGELSIMNWIKNLKAISEEAYEQLQGEDSANL